MISRRDFLKTLAGIAPILGGAGLCLSSPLWERLLTDDHGGLLFALDTQTALIRSAPRARYWTSVPLAGADCRQCHHPQEKLSGKRIRHEAGIVKCLLCAQGCVIKVGNRGRGRARMNVNGELKSLVYGRPMTIHIDPIEKKPFYHFLPGAAAFSLATSGCPLRCKFCQNWEISQASPEDYQVPPTPPPLIVRSSRAREAPVATLERSRKMAMDRGMHYAYVGNVPDHPGNHTYCPSCGKAVIKRTGFFIAEMHVKKDLCAFCRAKISGVWT